MYREMEAGVDGEFGLAHMTGLCIPPGCAVAPRVIIRLLADGRCDPGLVRYRMLSILVKSERGGGTL